MKQTTNLVGFLLISMMVLVACGSGATATYDVRGTWDYVFTTPNGNIWDEGTITFKGSPTKGTFVQVNIYDVEYEGAYTVRDEQLTIEGPETWEGAFLDENEIVGTWEGGGDRGTWVATR